MRSISYDADSILEICWRGQVVEERPDVRLLHQRQDLLRAVDPAFKVAKHGLPVQWLHPLDVFPFAICLGAEGHDVHRLALFDRERQDVAAVAKVHLCIPRQFVAHEFRCVVHRNETSIGVLPGKDGVSSWMVCADDCVADFAFDPIAAYKRIMPRRSAICEAQRDRATVILYAFQPLPKVSDFLRYQGDELIEIPRSMDASLAGLAPEVEEALAILILRVLSFAEGKPVVLSIRPAVVGDTAKKTSMDCRVDELHRPGGVGSQRHSCTYLCKRRRRWHSPQQVS